MDTPDHLTPKLPLTVPLWLWEDMAESVGVAFADSYLSGAVAGPTTVLPRFHIAWERLRARPAAMAVFARNGLRLVEPEAVHRAAPRVELNRRPALLRLAAPA